MPPPWLCSAQEWKLTENSLLQLIVDRAVSQSVKAFTRNISPELPSPFTCSPQWRERKIKTEIFNEDWISNEMWGVTSVLTLMIALFYSPIKYWLELRASRCWWNKNQMSNRNRCRSIRSTERSDVQFLINFKKIHRHYCREILLSQQKLFRIKHKTPHSFY